MAITVETSIDRVEAVNIDSLPSVQVRSVRVVKDDDTEVAKTYIRRTIARGNDWSAEPQQVRDVCAIFLI